MDFDECGNSLGCILYPSYCTGDNCYAGAAFKDEGNRTRFKTFVGINEGYISLGFSDDRLMVKHITFVFMLLSKEIFSK